ncbi:long-chain-fatty-acid--CoA ligase [Glacieibacterium frigidum]|uniref:Long-chain fatty acid--CoA ligase n=1 Tax=Glacieibacterium frigidum TaxID=2593303 RepID=A0A552UHJ9_9SPHN|nr:long-chain fatty acid--CoA ligase [Glacieibacterium frigidum]
MSLWSTAYDHPGAWDDVPVPCPMPDLLRRSAARTPQAPCLDFLGRGWTYAAVWDQVQRFAGGLAARGIGRGTTVGLFLPNCPHYVIAYYGAMLSGATLVNFSPLYTVDELRAQVLDSGTTVMVTLDVTALYPVIAQVPGLRLIVGNLPEVLPPLKSLGYRLLKRAERATVSPSDLRFADLLKSPPLANPPAIDVNDVALLQYTGGTTGSPKGAVLTHANLSINAGQVNALDPEPEEADRILGALPFFHVFANTCILNRTILRGGQIVMLPRFELKAVLAAIPRYKITAMPGVPTMYRALLDSPELGDTDLSSLRICISGGAPLPLELKSAFETRSGARLVEGYGLTESSGVVSCNPYAGGGVEGSIGQPLPGTDIRLVDKDDPARPAPDGEPGEITVSGPQIMARYHGQAGETANVFIEHDGRRWLRTGDVGTIDARGYVSVVDRLKDMIVVGGFKVFPSILEDILYKVPGVREALVIGIPDRRQGERPKAFVTLDPGAATDGEALLAHLNAHVGKHERAVAVEVRDQLPKTMIGKLSRKELVAEELAKAAA